MSILNNPNHYLPKGDLGYQRNLFPVEALQIHRSSQGSADLKLIVTANNNKDFAVKTVDDGNGLIPASELFCYELASLVDIPTPEYSLVLMPDSTIAFGSVWEGGVSLIRYQNQMMDILEGRIKVRDLKRFLSQVYALDLFINNIDRHFGNYLFRQSYNSLIGLAFDFSRAWYEVNAYDYNALNDSDCNTNLYHQIIKRCGMFSRECFLETLVKIDAVKNEQIVAILKSTPDEWLDLKTRSEIIAWWGSLEMSVRISKLKSGGKNALV